MRCTLKKFLWALAIGLFLPSVSYAQICPTGSTCSPFETYIYGQSSASQPYAGSLRIPAVPSTSPSSSQWIAANLLATLTDYQVLTNKTINCASNTCSIPTTTLVGNLSISNF